MNVIVGNKSELALEIICAEQDPSDGTIYMYVNGQKFGYERHEYEVAPAIKNVVQYFSVPEHDYKKLINCPLPVLFSAFDIAYEEDLESDEPGFIEELKKHRVNEYYSGFFNDFVNSSELDDCMFRQGNYMFDDATCLVVPKGDAIRICVRNDLTGDSAEVISTSDDFIDLWRKLADSVE
jgi:hypothetical protein